MLKPVSILSSLLLIITACNQSQPDTPGETVSEKIIEIDSCDIALTAGSDINIESQITGYQDAVNKNTQALINLEKLGWAFIAQARSTFDNGYYNLALETSKCIQQKDSEHSAALMLQAHIAHQLHKFKEAESLARKLIGQRGYWYEYGLLGDALMEQGRLDDAEQAYQSMMNQRPGPQAYSRAAHLRWLKCDLPGAIEMAQLTVVTYGHGNNEPANWAKTRLGFYLLLGGDFSGAGQIIDHTLTLNNNYAPALYIKGRLELAQNNPETAITVLNRAVDLDPAPEYLWTLLEALVVAEKYQQATLIKTQFEKNAAVQDPRAYALYLATSGHNKTIALQLASEQLKQRQDIFSLDAIAWALFVNNQISSAVKYMQNALANGTHHARLYYHAALIFLADNNHSQAGKWFAKAEDNQHMLLPSERSDLKTKFAIFLSHNQNLESNFYDQINLIAKGDKNENTI